MKPIVQSAMASGVKLTPQAVMAQMHLQPAQKPQLERIVAAGMKVMFSEETHDLMLKQLKGKGSWAVKLGEGVAGLIALLLKESNNSLPPDLMVPAGMVLIAHAADYLRKTKVEVTDADVADAFQVFISVVLKQLKIDPEKLAAVGGGLAQPESEGLIDSAGGEPPMEEQPVDNPVEELVPGEEAAPEEEPEAAPPEEEMTDE